MLRKKEKNTIFAYSAIKIRANFNPPYSTLNPETNSDSPSARSKGARLVSAKQLKTKIKTTWKKKIPKKKWQNLPHLKKSYEK